MNLNIPVQPSSGTMDLDEFTAFVETRPHRERWELVEGIAAMMAPPSYAHQRIARNLSELLNRAFEVRALDLFAYMAAGVRSPELRNFQPEPDIVVVPGVAGYENYSDKFQLAGEVMSPSNSRDWIDMKLRRYREAPHNLYAVVIEQREYMVEIHAHRANWRPPTLSRPDDVIEMPEFGLSCRVIDLYRGTPLDPERSASA